MEQTIDHPNEVFGSRLMVSPLLSNMMLNASGLIGCMTDRRINVKAVHSLLGYTYILG
jgi:hypothetical protein